MPGDSNWIAFRGKELPTKNQNTDDELLKIGHEILSCYATFDRKSLADLVLISFHYKT